VKRLVLLTIMALTSLTAFAKPQTVTLEVPGMTCITCPLTVKMALKKVDGVTNAEVTYETRLAVVTFDDEKTNVEALKEATKNAGYPSTIKE